MRSLRTLRIAASVLLATGGAVVACYNEVPGPQGPLPSPIREAPPMGPTPTSPLPPARLVEPAPDGGLPVPLKNPAALQVPVAGKAVAQADTGSGSGSDAGAGSDAGSSVPPPPPPVFSDAGVDGPADLPAEVPDAGPTVFPDAGHPLRR